MSGSLGPERLAPGAMGPYGLVVPTYHEGYVSGDGVTIAYHREWAKQHPLEGDGLLLGLYDHLSKSDKTEERRLRSAWIPDTVVFEHNFPRAWYSYDTKACEITRHPGSDLDADTMFRAFAIQREGCDIVAQLYYTDPQAKKQQEDQARHSDMRRRAAANGFGRSTREGSPTSSAASRRGGRPGDHDQQELNYDPDALPMSVEFFTKATLHDFLYKRPVKPDGILQRFVIPKGKASSKRNFQLQAVWSPLVSLVYKRRSNKLLFDKSLSPVARATTFDGAPHYSTETLVAPSTQKRIELVSKDIVDHFNVTEHRPISRIILYFKEDAKDRLWLLWASSLRVGSDRLNPVHQRVPLSLALRAQHKATPGALKTTASDVDGTASSAAGSRARSVTGGVRGVSASHVARAMSGFSPRQREEVDLVLTDARLYQLTGDTAFATKFSGTAPGGGFRGSSHSPRRPGTAQTTAAAAPHTSRLRDRPTASPTAESPMASEAGSARVKFAPAPPPAARTARGEIPRGLLSSGLRSQESQMIIAPPLSSPTEKSPPRPPTSEFYSPRPPFFALTKPDPVLPLSDPRHPLHDRAAAVDEALANAPKSPMHRRTGSVRDVDNVHKSGRVGRLGADPGYDREQVLHPDDKRRVKVALLDACTDVLYQAQAWTLGQTHLRSKAAQRDVCVDVPQGLLVAFGSEMLEELADVLHVRLAAADDFTAEGEAHDADVIAANHAARAQEAFAQQLAPSAPAGNPTGSRRQSLHPQSVVDSVVQSRRQSAVGAATSTTSSRRASYLPSGNIGTPSANASPLDQNNAITEARLRRNSNSTLPDDVAFAHDAAHRCFAPYVKKFVAAREDDNLTSGTGTPAAQSTPGEPLSDGEGSRPGSHHADGMPLHLLPKVKFAVSAAAVGRGRRGDRPMAQLNTEAEEFIDAALNRTADDLVPTSDGQSTIGETGTAVVHRVLAWMHHECLIRARHMAGARSALSLQKPFGRTGEGHGEKEHVTATSATQTPARDRNANDGHDQSTNSQQQGDDWHMAAESNTAGVDDAAAKEDVKDDDGDDGEWESAPVSPAKSAASERSRTSAMNPDALMVSSDAVGRTPGPTPQKGDGFTPRAFDAHSGTNTAEDRHDKSDRDDDAGEDEDKSERSPEAAASRELSYAEKHGSDNGTAPSSPDRTPLQDRTESSKTDHHDATESSAKYDDDYDDDHEDDLEDDDDRAGADAKNDDHDQDDGEKTAEEGTKAAEAKPPVRAAKAEWESSEDEAPVGEEHVDRYFDDDERIEEDNESYADSFDIDK